MAPSTSTSSSPRQTKGKRQGSQSDCSLSLLPPPPVLDDLDANTLATLLSPPPTPKGPSHRPRLSLGLRSNSGLSLHTNQAAFRQYTNYGSDGALRSPALPLSPRLLPDFFGNADSASGSSQTSMAVYDDLTPPYSPPGLDFFSRDVIQMVLHNPATAQRLCKFAQSGNRGNEMEFLVKVDEYSRALNNLTSLVNHISTTFSSVTTLSPLALPPEVGTILASNLKNFNKQMLPVLERLFREAKNAVEKRITKDVYPEFVKYQLIQCVKSSLSVSNILTREFQSAYPGLGNSFVLTDPIKADNPIVFSSDGFTEMTGFSRAEAVNINCRFLQGLAVDRSPGQRIKQAVSLGQETTQLLLNYRKDGSAFWNLLFVCPLHEQGRVRYFLGAQINVSENVGSHYKDILRILDFGPLPGGSTSDKDEGDREKSPRKSPERRVERVPTSQPREERRRSQRSRFFKSFTRKPGSPTRARANTLDSNPEDVALPKVPGASVSEASLSPIPNDQICPYPQFMVMRFLPGHSRSPQLDRRGSIPAPSMPLVYCSMPVLELLGLEQYEKDVVLDQDIFSVLVDQGGSPTVTRALKTAIRDKMTAGEIASADLLVNADPQARQPSRHGRKNSIMSLSGRSRDNGGSASELEGYNGKLRKSETLERSAELVSNVIFGVKMRKLISHWTPLKDVEGTVSYVVLVLSPASS